MLLHRSAGCDRLPSFFACRLSITKIHMMQAAARSQLVPHQPLPPVSTHHLCAQADTVFTSMLADIRSGRCPAQTLKELQTACCRLLDTSDGILPTQVWGNSRGPLQDRVQGLGFRV